MLDKMWHEGYGESGMQGIGLTPVIIGIYNGNGGIPYCFHNLFRVVPYIRARFCEFRLENKHSSSAICETELYTDSNTNDGENRVKRPK